MTRTSRYKAAACGSVVQPQPARPTAPPPYDNVRPERRDARRETCPTNLSHAAPRYEVCGVVVAVVVCVRYEIWRLQAGSQRRSRCDGNDEQARFFHVSALQAL